MSVLVETLLQLTADAIELNDEFADKQLNFEEYKEELCSLVIRYEEHITMQVQGVEVI